MLTHLIVPERDRDLASAASTASPDRPDSVRYHLGPSVPHQFLSYASPLAAFCSVVLGTIFCAAFLMIQLQTKPYLQESDDYFALASSFSMLVLFLCCMVYKYDALTSEASVIGKMSLEQREDYGVSSLLLSVIDPWPQRAWLARFLRYDPYLCFHPRGGGLALPAATRCT